MKCKNVLIKGLAALAIIAGVAGITTNTKAKSSVGFSIGVGSPYHGYSRFGRRCRYVEKYVDAAGVVHRVVRYRPCNYGAAYPAASLGIWGGRHYGGRRYFGGRRYRGRRGRHRRRRRRRK